MKRVLVLLIMAFLISGGTIGILYQEGIGGIGGGAAKTEDTEDVIAEEEELELLNEDAEENVIDDEDAEAEDEDAKAEEEAAKQAEEEAAKEAEEAAAEEKEAEEEAEKKAEEKAAKKKAKQEAKEAGAPYYSFTVVGIGGILTIHSTPTQGNDGFATANEGDAGYIIQDDGGDRVLCYVDGVIGYLHKGNLNVTEIATSDYPDKLLKVTADQAGSEFTL